MKQKMVLVLLLLLCGVSFLKPMAANLLASGSGQDMVEILSSNLQNGAIAAYQKVELQLKIVADFTNPYDPEEITVDAIFTSPDNRQYKVPGFYYEPFSRKTNGNVEEIKPNGSPDWRIRFTPEQVGEWSGQIRVTTKGNQEASVKEAVAEAVVAQKALEFTVTAEPNHGFVRVDPNQSGYFVFDNGHLYLPIGSNVCWANEYNEHDKRGMIAYETWFSQMADNGANFARIWLAPWGFAPEWKDTGLGNYSARQNRAWQLDYLFDLAAQKNIFLMICILNHGQFSSGTNPDWENNPYNVKSGGFLKEPVEFLTDPLARKLFKQKLRYIVARWGYSTHLFAWEWWNEVNLTDGLSEEKALTPWLSEMGAYLETLDPYHHMVTNSYSSGSRGYESYWNTKEIDLIQIHKYNIYDWAEDMSRTMAECRRYTQKPVMYGEFGMQQAMAIDLKGVHFHEGLWGGLFSGTAGTGMIWYWDLYLEKLDLFHHYRGISKFFAGEELQREGLEPMVLPSTGKVEAYGLVRANKALVWIKSIKYSYREVENLAFKYGLGKGEFPEITKAQVTIPDLTPGTYWLEAWNPATGVMTSRKQVRVTKALVLNLPKFRQDLAYKIYGI
jgi:hypothetical protein